MTERVLVTGGTGFLGSHLVRLLRKEGRQVRVLVRRPERMGLLKNVDGLETVAGDVLDVDSVRDALTGVTQVFHCAAFVGFGGRAELDPMMDVNVGGTRNVVNEALKAGVGRLVHTSSIAALGRTERPTGCLNEQAVWTESPMNTAYARSKHLAELEVHRAIAEGLDAVIVNPSLIMGAGRPGENTTQIAERIRDRRLPAFPSGATNVVDVEDVATGHLAALARGEKGQRYILGGENLTWQSIILTLAGAFGVPPPTRHMSARAAMILGAAGEIIATVTRRPPMLTREGARVTGHKTCYENARARTELGMTFRPFKETAQRMAGALAR
ncbi:MAG: dihydroflavonol-4-reductase [Rhodothermales bacterium]